MPRMGLKVGTLPGTPAPEKAAIGCGDKSPIQWCGQFEPLPISRSGVSLLRGKNRCPLGTACLVERGTRCCRPPCSGLRHNCCSCLAAGSASATPGSSLLSLCLSV